MTCVFLKDAADLEAQWNYSRFQRTSYQRHCTYSVFLLLPKKMSFSDWLRFWLWAAAARLVTDRRTDRGRHRAVNNSALAPRRVDKKRRGDERSTWPILYITSDYCYLSADLVPLSWQPVRRNDQAPDLVTIHPSRLGHYSHDDRWAPLRGFHFYVFVHVHPIFSVNRHICLKSTAYFFDPPCIAPKIVRTNLRRWAYSQCVLCERFTNVRLEITYTMYLCAGTSYDRVSVCLSVRHKSEFYSWTTNRAGFGTGASFHPSHPVLKGNLDIFKNKPTCSLWKFVQKSGLGKFCYVISIVETCYRLSSRKAATHRAW